MSTARAQGTAGEAPAVPGEPIPRRTLVDLLPAPGSDGSQGMPTLREALQTALDLGDGRIAFADFMQLALHHPGEGYYAARIRGIGTGGDFTTAPALGPALGRAVARWLLAAADTLGWGRFAVIECGPGNGALGAAVWRELGWRGRRRATLNLVETSVPLREQQKAALRRVSARWHADIGAALAACDGRALIYHNEFFDAFPCRVFRKCGEAWHELFLRVEAGRLAGVFEPPRAPLPPSKAFALPWNDGQRLEVFASVRGWMQDLSAHWREGAMLVIDYGGAPQAVYHRRPHGTLRGYRGHQRVDGEAVYEIPGRQDLTADVNFSDLESWAKEVGWRIASNSALADFLDSAATPGLDDLTGAGGAFRVLAVECTQAAGG